MATCIERLPCPDCGSPSGLQTYLNTDEALGMEWVTSFCHSACWENKGDPYQGSIPEVHVKSPEEIKEEVEVIRTCEIFKPKRRYRKIPSAFYYSWGVRVLLSEFDGKTPYALGFPYSSMGSLVGWKCRPLKKKDFFGVGRTSDVDMFGLERAFRLAHKIMWVTEGEFDAIALDYCMSLAGKEEAYPVVSLTHGGGSLEQNLDKVTDRLAEHKIDTLVFVLDDDEVGHKAELVAKDLWPTAHIIRKPKGCKDANDAVKQGKAVEMGQLALGII